MVPLCIIAIPLAILISCNTTLSSRGACIVIFLTIVMVIVITIVMVIVIPIVMVIVIPIVMVIVITIVMVMVIVNGMVMVIKIGHGHHFVTKNHFTKDARRV